MRRVGFVIGAACTIAAMMWACASFDAEGPATEPADTAPPPTPITDVTTDTGRGPDVVVREDAGPSCEPAAAFFEERFDSGFGLLMPEVANGGDASVVNGALVADVPNVDRARSEARRSFGLPSEGLARASLHFVVRNLVRGPPGQFLELGCAIELRRTSVSAWSQMRFEFKDGSYRLDDEVRSEDGGPTDSGIGTEVVVIGVSPQTVEIDVSLELAPDGGSFLSRATVDRKVAVSFIKVTPLFLVPATVILRCGITGVDAPSTGDASTRFAAVIDDVRLQLCKRPP